MSNKNNSPKHWRKKYLENSDEAFRGKAERVERENGMTMHTGHGNENYFGMNGKAYALNQYGQMIRDNDKNESE